MYDVLESKSFAADMDALWQDGRASLVAAVDARVDEIASGARIARQHAFRSDVLVPDEAWGTVVADGGERWMIVWGETAPGTVTLHALARTVTF